MEREAENGVGACVVFAGYMFWNVLDAECTKSDIFYTINY
jgi:hypothetical protein